MEKERREVASLTKIMTIYTVLNLCDQFELPISTTQIQISEDDAEVTGTSAQLNPGDKLTVEQLLYGLMLPSGNDVAYCLGSYFG